MKRKPLLADWPGPWGAWAGKYCFNNAWRVASTLGDQDDALAECAMLFIECKKRYGAVVDNAAWFMRMYQIMVVTRFCDLSTKDSRYRDAMKCYEYHTSTVDVMALLAHRTVRGSSELKQVIHVLLNAPTEVLETLSNECSTPKKFFHKIALSIGISKAKSGCLVKELQTLLS